VSWLDGSAELIEKIQLRCGLELAIGSCDHDRTKWVIGKGSPHGKRYFNHVKGKWTLAPNTSYHHEYLYDSLQKAWTAALAICLIKETIGE